eukprot:2622169-Pleurochrysis_carterae.AAC.2
MAAIVAPVAVEAAFASDASKRTSSLPLPSQAREYVRRTAGQEMICKMEVISLRYVALMSSGAIEIENAFGRRRCRLRLRTRLA